MANYRRLVSKLQTALSFQERIIRMNTYQFHSNEQNRMINCYVLVEKKPKKNRKGETVMKDVQIYKSSSLPDIVKFLAGEYKAGDG